MLLLIALLLMVLIFGFRGIGRIAVMLIGALLGLLVWIFALSAYIQHQEFIWEYVPALFVIGFFAVAYFVKIPENRRDVFNPEKRNDPK